MSWSFIGAGPAVSSAAAVDAVWPAGISVDDFAVLVVETGGEGTTSSPAGWTHFTGSPLQDVLSAAGSKLNVLWKWADGDAEIPAAIADSGDHQVARIFVYRGIDRSSPINAVASATKAVASTALAFPTVSTGVADCAVLMIASRPSDDSTTAFWSAAPSGGTGLAGFSDRGSALTTLGHGGGLNVVDANMASAGATGAPAGTLGLSSTNVAFTIALAPGVIVPGVDVTRETGFVAVGPAPGVTVSRSSALVAMGVPAGVQVARLTAYVALNTLPAPPAPGTEQAQVQRGHVYNLAEAAALAETDEAVVYALGAAGGASADVLEGAVYSLGASTPTSSVSEAGVYTLALAEPCLTQRCQLWTLTRRDGVVLAFTSHDRDITRGDLVYRSCASLNASASENSSTLGSVGNIELSGIIDDDAISEQDLYGGLWDDAFVTVDLFNWGDNAVILPVRLASGWTGKMSQGEGGFEMEVLGVGARLGQQALVQMVTPGCRWVFGDTRCGVDLGPLTITGAVVSATNRSRFLATLSAGDGGLQWANGRVRWTSGLNDGLVLEVKSVDFGAGDIALWPSAAYRPEVGDTFDLLPGCDRAFDGGCAVYNNRLRYGGFPDVPGSDAIMETPDAKY